MRRGAHRIRALASAALVPLLIACAGETADEGAPKKLVLGLVPALEAQKLIDNLDPLADYLSQELGVPVESFVPQDYTGLLEAMGSGRADIGMIPPFAAMLGEERYGIDTILISMREGEATYHSQWMTLDPSLCDSPPERDEDGLLYCRGPIEQVRGKSVAFTDPTSTSGYLFPAVQLLEAGINPETDIQPVFVGGHDAAVIAVLKGDVEVGVCYDDARVYGSLPEQFPDIAETVIVFNQSPEIPNDGVTVRGDLPAETKAAITAAFLKLVDAESSKPREERLLWKLYEIDGFVPYTEGLHEPVRKAFLEMRDRIDVDR
ncbi:MAG: phosphate/phosphite/phosphonate ABC transporter substrate-binding protein [Thermoanaerobaculia bacterium]